MPHQQPGQPKKRIIIPIRTIEQGDLKKAMSKGYQDFMNLRGDLLIIGLLYPFLGVIMTLLAANELRWPIIFPIIAGLTLVGPFLSVGFYEMARLRAAGQKPRWTAYFTITRAKNFSDILFIGMILMAAFILWVVAAMLIYVTFMGADFPPSPWDFLVAMVTTLPGWTVIILGNMIGACFGFFVLLTSFISLPMLVDHDIDSATAIRTSIRAFQMNKLVTIRWGIKVVILLFLGCIPMFLGLVIILPMLAYATWHLYTAIVDGRNLPAAIRRKS